MKNINIITFGCSANFSDSEVIAGLLSKAGFRITDQRLADLIIVSICTVKGSNKYLKFIKRLDKPIVVSGCIPQDLIDELTSIPNVVSLIDTNNLSQIVGVVKQSFKNKHIIFVKQNKELKLNLPKVRKNKIISIVPISSGCNSTCSYCSVRLIKGKLFSYPKESVLKEVENSIKDGCVEVWLTAQDTAAYGLDVNNSYKKGIPKNDLHKNDISKLPDLIDSITQIKGEFFIRIGMMNPQHVLKVLPSLISSYKPNKIFKFLHLPVQSGSNKILKAMNRDYSVSDFKEIVSGFRKEFPKITISTDIICGFPCETEEDFNQTLSLIKEIKPDVLNISRYSPRPHTSAFELKQIPSWIVKERSRELNLLFKKISLDNNKSWLGWKGRVLVDEEGKNNTLIGRNFAYKPIILRKDLLEKGKALAVGDIQEVEIKEVTEYDLRGGYSFFSGIR